MPRNLIRTILFTLSCIAASLAAQFASAQTAYGITSTNQLIRFDLATPGTVSQVTPISGLSLGETLVGIDFRPLNGQLVGLGSLNRLYTINTTTGAATVIGTNCGCTLTGTSFGFDVNPVVDRIRVVSDQDQNLRLNPLTGGLAAIDTPLAYAAGDVNAAANPNVVGSAYTNNYAGAQLTTLYGIDSNLDILVTQNPPNGGALNTVGPLGVNTSGVVGFDILTTPSGNTGYAAMVVGGVSRLFQINLATGAATLVGAIAAPATVTGLAIPPDNPRRLSNISTRMQVGTSGDVMIGGFVIGGSANKTVAIVATGPSLAGFGISNPLANPTLTLVRSSDQSVVSTNDDWQAHANQAALSAAGFAPSNALEAGMLINLAPGAYTVIVEGVGGGTGVAVIGVYEVDSIPVPLTNISTRGRVLTGNDRMIGGFVIGGTTTQTVAIVATGPSLAPFGVANPLANPTITLVRSSDQATLATNDDWQAHPNAALLQAAGFAPSDPLESGIYTSLPPGGYTVIVEGVGGGTGVAVIGVYKVN